MGLDLRRFGAAALVRAFGLTFIGPFAALYLLNIGALSYVAVGLILAAIGIPPLLWTPVAGLIADRVGRRVVFLVAMAGEAAGTAAMAVAVALGSTAGFAVAIAFLSLMGATGGPALSAYVADFVEGSERTEAFTWYRIGHNAGFASGVAVGGVALAIWGFLPATILSTGVLIAGVLYVASAIPPSPVDERLREVRATGASTGAGRRSASQSLRTWSGDRLFLTTALAFGLAALVTGQWNVTYGLYGSRTLGLSYGVIGAGFALNGALVVLGQAWTTHRMIGRRHTSIGALGTVLYAGSFLALGAAPFLGIPVVVPFLLATAVLTFGENLLAIPYSTLPSNLAPSGELGAYNGAFQTLTGIGIVLAPLVGGVALAAIPDPRALWIVLVAPTVPALLLLRWVGHRIPAGPNRA